MRIIKQIASQLTSLYPITYQLDTKAQFVIADQIWSLHTIKPINDNQSYHLINMSWPIASKNNSVRKDPVDGSEARFVKQRPQTDQVTSSSW